MSYETNEWVDFVLPTQQNEATIIIIGSGALLLCVCTFLPSTPLLALTHTHTHTHTNTHTQITQQFPLSFEFNEQFLHSLFVHSYYSNFGTYTISVDQSEIINAAPPLSSLRQFPLWHSKRKSQAETEPENRRPLVCTISSIRNSVESRIHQLISFSPVPRPHPSLLVCTISSSLNFFISM